MRKNIFSFLFSGSLLIVGCYTGPDDKPGSEAVVDSFDQKSATAFVDSINQVFTKQVRNGDSAGLAAHYHSGAELLFANSEPIRGKDILSAWGSIIRMGVKNFTFKTTDLSGSHNLLVETGSYEMKSAGDTLIDRGKYLVVWKKENGAWKLFRDVGNTSLPSVIH